MTEQKRLSPGQQAPDFTLDDSTGQQISLSDYRGKYVVVYFYPAAGTPGCTTQANDFRDHLTELNNAGYHVLGISPDTPEKLAAFVQDKQLTFPLLSDPDKTVLAEWGAFGEKKNYGKTVQGVIRSTFAIDPEGTIVLARYNVRATGHVPRLLKELQISAS